jgi:NTP pyrophosphatase (non-canonical NTP hydrolase)
MFALVCLANSHDIDLDESWKHVMDKCYGRDNDRFEKRKD